MKKNVFYVITFYDHINDWYKIAGFLDIFKAILRRLWNPNN